MYNTNAFISNLIPLNYLGMQCIMYTHYVAMIMVVQLKFNN
jgi:hypothetical protein